MDVLNGHGTETLTQADVAALMAAHRLALVDIGCGDGAYPYRIAGDFPDTVCIGVDPNREGMQPLARKARRRPARGGRPNLLFVPGALEQMPAELAGYAHLITINFPWAGLLDRILRGDDSLARGVQQLAAPSCTLQILLNAEVALGGLPPITPDTMRAALSPVCVAAAFRLERTYWLPPQVQVRSRWGGRLIRGSRRRVVCVRAQRGASRAEAVAVLDGAARSGLLRDGVGAPVADLPSP